MIDESHRHNCVNTEPADTRAHTDTNAESGRLRPPRMPCALTARDDAETTVTFHVDDAPAVFQLMKPYRRRHVTEAARRGGRTG